MIMMIVDDGRGLMKKIWLWTEEVRGRRSARSHGVSYHELLRGVFDQ